jgi:uncharacterized membrane protein YkvA (DUF1232 family)
MVPFGPTSSRSLEAQLSEHISALAQWALGWRKDLKALEQALASDKAHAEIRRYAAAALNYVVSRMDLVPDWEPAVGLFDDLMVVRICAVQGSSAAGGTDSLDEATATDWKRLAAQADGIRDFLGDDLFAKLTAYCDRQAGEAVRGRSPDQLIADARARAQLFTEVEAAVSRAGEVSVPDASQAAVRLKAYLGHKLK